jgi:hypothetical protein
MRAGGARRLQPCLGRHVLHRQEQQRRAERGHQLHVQVVPQRERLLRLSPGRTRRVQPLDAGPVAVQVQPVVYAGGGRCRS